MNLKEILDMGNDPGKYFQGELEEAITPVTKRIEALEKKIDLLILSIERLEKIVNALEPVLNILRKFTGQGKGK